MSLTKSENILVIGAGVSGLTTAIVCQIAGFDVQIVTKDLPFQSVRKSEFSSLFPAASIIPHSVIYPDLLSLFEESASVFETLYQHGVIGIEKHRHYELFSVEREFPDYAKCYTTFEPLSDHENAHQINHPLIHSKFGWSFDCLFTDWEIYYPYLFKLFENLGGRVIAQSVHPDSLSKLDADIIINCSELYGEHILGEVFNPHIYRGHLLHIPGMPILKNQSNQKVSYNFTPNLNIYSTENGNEQDVYFYQRNDRWIFGGSRQKGTIDFEGNWIGEQVIDPIIKIDNVSIPEQILELNLEIITHSFGAFDIDIDSIIPKVGYRFMGNNGEQLRLDYIEKGDKLIVNNFGHGGSGVTLSWGCALRCLNLISNKISWNQMNPSTFSQKLLSVI